MLAQFVKPFCIFDCTTRFASVLLTDRDLELQINAWSFIVTDTKALHRSITELISLYLRIMTDDQKGVNLNDLFHRVVSRMLQERLPYNVQESLGEARKSFDENDSMNDIVTHLINATKRLVAFKQTPKVHAVEYNSGEAEQLALTHEPKDQVATGQRTVDVEALVAELKRMSVTQPPTSNTGAVPKTNAQLRRERYNASKKARANQVKQTGQPYTPQQKQQQPQQNQYQGKQQNGSSQNNNYNTRNRFVARWPEGKPYKTGSSLSQEFNRHFDNACFRCGYSGHLSSACRTYPERQPIMLLCNVCRQGLHEKCRSKRYNVQDGKNNPHSIEAQQAIGKILQEMSGIKTYQQSQNRGGGYGGQASVEYHN